MSIHQEITINGSPAQVYQTLLSSEGFSAFTGAPAEIMAVEGGEFSCFGGQITGRIVELKENERIVQAWRAGPWPEGVFSIVRFTLQPAPQGSTLLLDHTGFPEGAEQHLDGGWKKMYWEPLAAHYAS